MGISSDNIDKYSQIIHLNYAKHRIFYTIDNFQDLINFDKNKILE